MFLKGCQTGLLTMHIIIDGYNLIRQSDFLRRIERISLEEGRKTLIRTMSLYRKQRGHRVTI
ncbi:MAG: NYN domain-containing protein, partial [Syntrophales bacterium]|nr:NYN domain-containing protein [Syntrophales bacterium]